ncbi:hypothetical protein CHUV0807_0696 [Cardiobacterium hominis]|uniref:Uncharacterized protein n=1 Tax=Cardiobacterium hominis TaxID=2718 RepID=A0A1C3H372_9GAMM|nr:hypothetical protein CHUV0807_0696 [Cardiobacterium hominis]
MANPKNGLARGRFHLPQSGYLPQTHPSRAENREYSWK